MPFSKEVMLLRRLAYGLAHVPMVIHLLIPVSVQAICQRPLAAGCSSSTACASTCLTWWLVPEKLLGHRERGSRAHGRVSAGWHTADRLARQRLPECPPAGTMTSLQAAPLHSHLSITTYYRHTLSLSGADNTLGCYRECSGESAPRWTHARP